MSLVENIAAPQTIAAALRQASVSTGTDFDYLLKTAMRESSLNSQAKSGTSSASGLFQFTEQSWLGTLKRNGEALGLGRYAEAICCDSRGRYVVENAAQRQEILALRHDAKASALMAGAYTQESANVLETRLGREASQGELYVAHFLGAGGASKLISAAEDTPNARADTLFPAAAAANKSIFYRADGNPRTVSEVYGNLVAKHENADTARMVETAENRLLSSNSRKYVTNARSGIGTDMAEAPVARAGRGYATRGAQMLSPVSTADRSAGAGTGVPAGYGRAGLKLTPAVLQVLASLDPIPEGSESLRSGDKDETRTNARERNEERRNMARMLPHSGFAYNG